MFRLFPIFMGVLCTLMMGCASIHREHLQSTQQIYEQSANEYASILRGEFSDYSSIKTKMRKSVTEKEYGYIVENFDDGKMVYIYDAEEAGRGNTSEEALKSMALGKFFVKPKEYGGFSVFHKIEKKENGAKKEEWVEVH